MKEKLIHKRREKIEAAIHVCKLSKELALNSSIICPTLKANFLAATTSNTPEATEEPPHSEQNQLPIKCKEATGS